RPLVRKAADYATTDAEVVEWMKAIANDPALIANKVNAQQGMRALYALDWAKIAKENPALVAKLIENGANPGEPIMQAVYTMFGEDDATAGYKKALSDVQAA